MMVMVMMTMTMIMILSLPNNLFISVYLTSYTSSPHLFLNHNILQLLIVYFSPNAIIRKLHQPAAAFTNHLISVTTMHSVC